MSKGKKVFTKAEADKIRSLITQKLASGRTEQKVIRDAIRDIGFYYSDFSGSKHGYTIADFDGLILTNKITIHDDIARYAIIPAVSSDQSDIYQTDSSKKPDIFVQLFIPETEHSILLSDNSHGNTSERLKVDEFLPILKANRFDPEISRTQIIPSKPGIYLICLREGAVLPSGSITPTVKVFDTLQVIYTGISKDLYNRDYKTHFTGNNAGRSTLRKSLGALMKYKFTPRSKNKPDDGRTKFIDVDEARLTLWMKKNLILYFYSTPHTLYYENMLINHFDPPLNLSKAPSVSQNSVFRSELSKLRNP